MKMRTSWKRVALVTSTMIGIGACLYSLGLNYSYAQAQARVLRQEGIIDSQDRLIAEQAAQIRQLLGDNHTAPLPPGVPLRWEAP